MRGTGGTREPGLRQDGDMPRLVKEPVGQAAGLVLQEEQGTDQAQVSPRAEGRRMPSERALVFGRGVCLNMTQLGL